LNTTRIVIIIIVPHFGYNHNFPARDSLSCRPFRKIRPPQPPNALKAAPAGEASFGSRRRVTGEAAGLKHTRRTAAPAHRGAPVCRRPQSGGRARGLQIKIFSSLQHLRALICIQDRTKKNRKPQRKENQYEHYKKNSFSSPWYRNGFIPCSLRRQECREHRLGRAEGLRHERAE